jgi:hypothetical protein
MLQNVLLAEYHGTLYDTPSNKMHHLQNKFGLVRDDQ